MIILRITMNLLPKNRKKVGVKSNTFNGRTNNVNWHNLTRNSDTGTCGNNPNLVDNIKMGRLKMLSRKIIL